MRQNFTKFARLSLCFILALVSCEDENSSTKNETLVQDSKIIEVQKWFNKITPELTVLKETKKLDWQHAIVTNGTKGKVVEVPIILNDNIAIKNDDKSITLYNRLMFIQDEKEGYKLSHVLIGTKKNIFDNNDKDFNFYKIEDDFEGSITVLNAKNEFAYYSVKAKKNTSPTSKIKSEEQVCLVFGIMFSDGSFQQLYIISCSGGGAGDGGGSGGSGDSGAYGAGDAPPEEDPCHSTEDKLKEIMNSSWSTSEFVSSTLVSQSNTTRTKNYKWTIFSGPGYRLCSSETGVHRKVANSNPALQWEWVSLTHNSIYREGVVAGGDISYSTIYSQPTVGIYTALMDLNYNVKFSSSFCGYPTSKEQNYNSHNVFNVND